MTIGDYFMTLTWTKTMLAAGLGLGLMAAPASAVQLRVTVTNLSPENGVTITPLWGAFHDGSFDLFAFQYFSYASMILPSNDQFIGNGNPFAFTLFDAAGNYLGDQTIGVFGTDAYDAGTEQNITDGAPFVPSLAGSTRVDD